MQTIILAGGVSTRLWPLGDKNLLTFCGQTLFEHQFEALNKAGLKTGVIIVNPESALAIKQIAGASPSGRPEYQVIVQPKPDGMGHAIQLASKKLNMDQPTVVVSLNDVVPESLFRDFLKQVKKHPKDYSLVGQHVASYFPGGYLKLKGQQIVEIVEKPAPGKEPSAWVNLVIHYIPKLSVFVSALNQAKISQTHYEETLGKLMKTAVFRLFQHSGEWFPIKYPWQVLDVMNYYLNRQDAKGAKHAKLVPAKAGNHIFIHKTAVVEGPVWIEEGVRILAGAVIKGPVYLGKNVIVANHALVRDSHIGADSVVGFSTEIARSYLGEKVWTHSNYIGDSIIGNNCSFGAGCITGNLRLDEKAIPSMIKGERINTERTKFGLVTGENLRCGINTNFMPGVKVGSNVMIGAGVSVVSDIPDGKFVSVKQELQIQENVKAGPLQDRGRFKKGI